MKFIVVLVAVVLLVGMLSASFRRLTGKRPGRSKEAPKAQGPALQAMHACAHCGVHMPESDMVLQGGRAYCCVAHLKAGPRDGSQSTGAAP